MTIMEIGQYFVLLLYVIIVILTKNNDTQFLQRTIPVVMINVPVYTDLYEQPNMPAALHMRRFATHHIIISSYLKL